MQGTVRSAASGGAQGGSIGRKLQGTALGLGDIGRLWPPAKLGARRQSYGSPATRSSARIQLRGPRR